MSLRHIPCIALLLCGANALANAQQISSVVDPIIEKEITTGVPGAAFIFVRDDGRLP